MLFCSWNRLHPVKRRKRKIWVRPWMWQWQKNKGLRKKKFWRWGSELFSAQNLFFKFIDYSQENENYLKLLDLLNWSWLINFPSMPPCLSGIKLITFMELCQYVNNVTGAEVEFPDCTRRVCWAATATDGEKLQCIYDRTNVSKNRLQTSHQSHWCVNCGKSPLYTFVF